MMAPSANAPMAGPHQPQRASAVVGVATVATASVPAAARAVRVFFMGSPLCELERGDGQTSSLSQGFHADAERGLNGSLQVSETLRRRLRPLSLRCTLAGVQRLTHGAVDSGKCAGLAREFRRKQR